MFTDDICFTKPIANRWRRQFEAALRLCDPTRRLTFKVPCQQRASDANSACVAGRLDFLWHNYEHKPSKGEMQWWASDVPKTRLFSLRCLRCHSMPEWWRGGKESGNKSVCSKNLWETFQHWDAISSLEVVHVCVQVAQQRMHPLEQTRLHRYLVPGLLIVVLWCECESVFLPFNDFVEIEEPRISVLERQT